MIYAIQKASGPIKIGYTDRLPSVRLSELQSQGGESLFLLATTEGGKAEERDLHIRFEEHRLIGEWFRPNDALVLEINTWLPADVGCSRLTLHLPKDLVDEIDRLAAAERRSRVGQIEVMLRKQVEKAANA